MIEPLSVVDLAHRFGGVLVNPKDAMTISSLSIDSRSLQKGDWFLALRGDRFDGHDYIQDVERAGAAGLIVEQSAQTESHLPQWATEDTLVSLGHIGTEWRAQFNNPLIAITGSNGKTSVKEMLRGVLAISGSVLATRGNFNNEIGVPLTLMNLNTDHSYAVVEMGARARGDIEYLCELTQPDVALVNNVGESHIENFGSRANIRDAKGEIYSGLKPGGTAIVNLDTDVADYFIQSISEHRVIGFSAERVDADVRATEIELRESGCQFQLMIGAESELVRLDTPARHNVNNALAAASCAHALGMSIGQIARGLTSFTGVAGRLQFLQGINSSRLIDDTYNANPTSAKAAVKLLAGMTGRRILVLGDMGELGEHASSMHADLGLAAAEQGIDALFATGEMSQQAVIAFGASGQWFDTQQALIEALQKQASPNTVILVKGSRSAVMEKVVEQLSASDQTTPSSPNMTEKEH